MTGSLDVDLHVTTGLLEDLVVDLEALRSGIDQTGERLDAVEARVAAARESLGMTPPPASTWDDLVRPHLSPCELLTDAERAAIRRRFVRGAQVRAGLDRYDVMAAVAAGVVASLVDWVCVRTPLPVKVDGDQRSGSVLTSAVRKLAVNHDNPLSEISKVGFDKVSGTGVEGMSPMTHRVQTFGHDPLIGLLLGTMDIVRGTMTAVDPTGRMQVRPGMAEPVSNPAVALGIEVVHLLSDVITAAGLPLPGWTALMTVGEVGDVDVADIARSMYVRGYDTWHFLTMLTPIAAVELVVRGYLGLRSSRDDEYRAALDAEQLESGTTRTSDLPRFLAMTLIGHGIAAGGNAAKVMAYQGNPLAINYNQWALVAGAIVGAIQTAAGAELVPEIEQHARNTIELDTGWARIRLDLGKLEKAVTDGRRV